jgi:hypothetical protein
MNTTASARLPSGAARAPLALIGEGFLSCGQHFSYLIMRAAKLLGGA